MQTPAFIAVQIAGAKLLLIDTGARANQARQQGFLGHFKREDSDWLRVFRIQGDVLSDVQGKRRFAHGGAGGQNEELAAVQAAGHFVQLEKSSGNAFVSLAGVKKGVEAALEGFDDAIGADERVFIDGLAHLQQGFFGVGADNVGVVLADQGLVTQLLADENDVPQLRLFMNDADIAVKVNQLRQAIVQRDDVAESIDRFELALAHELVRKTDAVDTLTTLEEFSHAGENAAMLFEAEVLGLEA